METDVLLTPPPDSIEGVFADRYFKQHLQYEIQRIKTHNHAVLPKGQKWKRTPYDTLFEKDLLNVTCVIEEYKNIMQRTSKLFAGCRNALTHIVAESTRNMYNEYRKINCMT